jgi:hypothetical protein
MWRPAIERGVLLSPYRPTQTLWWLYQWRKYFVGYSKTTNTCTELHHSFIQYTGSYMFRQWSAIIRELLGFVWVIWNADRIGGISYTVCLCGLCEMICYTVSVSFLHNLQVGSPSNMPVICRCLLTAACPVSIATTILSWCLLNLSGS